MSAHADIVWLRQEIDRLVSSATSAPDLMSRLTELLHAGMAKYNWVGFYTLEPIPGQASELVLCAFQGAMTPHTRIPLTQGICGAAASTGKTVVVDDVHQDPRYLACSLETKSEIVAPVFVRGQVVGELDIDSHLPAAFTTEDRHLVEYCATAVGKFLEQHRS